MRSTFFSRDRKSTAEYENINNNYHTKPIGDTDSNYDTLRQTRVSTRDYFSNDRLRSTNS